MSNEDGIQRRQFFRLPYPKAARPQLRTDDGNSYEVLEISEEGVILNHCAEKPFVVGDAICGKILFRNKETEYIEGLVFRLKPSGAVVTLSNKIDFHHVIREQTYISRNFPLFFRQKMAGDLDPDSESDNQ